MYVYYKNRAINSLFLLKEPILFISKRNILDHEYYIIFLYSYDHAMNIN